MKTFDSDTITEVRYRVYHEWLHVIHDGPVNCDWLAGYRAAEEGFDKVTTYMRDTNDKSKRKKSDKQN